MSIRRVLLLLKPLDVYPTRPTGKISSPLSLVRNPQILGYLDDRCRIHKDTINFCQDVLQRRSLDWKTVASHFMDDSIPMLGVNSDPTQVEEVKEFSHEFDATRSTGYLCAATAGNFEQVFDEVLEGCKAPSELSRMSISLNGQLLSTCALNDVLVAHPCPAAVSRFSFLIKRDGQRSSSLVSCRSSGLRVSTATGSTAAMLSAGGFLMPILSQDLQYIVREPISPGDADSHLMHGVINSDQTIHVTWCSKEGIVYIDGSHVFHLVEHGDIIELSSKAPILKVFLPSHLLS
ncbi:NAD(H) kinase 3 isoform X2 [Tasmannia lanceolata]|uniref:NAD(H) kinase 3 isoform X2 n=1 Tax=Tasmannia lanceolata TaxID=3420 RepID=UPI004063E2E3